MSDSGGQNLEKKEDDSLVQVKRGTAEVINEGPPFILQADDGAVFMTASLSPNSGWERFLDIMFPDCISFTPINQRGGFKNNCKAVFRWMLWKLLG